MGEAMDPSVHLDSDFITSTEACEILRVRNSTLYEYVRLHLLTSYPNKRFDATTGTLVHRVPTPITTRIPGKVYLRAEVEHLRDTHTRGFGDGRLTSNTTTTNDDTFEETRNKQIRALRAMGIDITTPK